MHANHNPHPWAPVRSVTGLGVCDVLRIELRPEQVPWLIDELEETRTALEEARVLSAGTSATASRDDETRLTLEYRLRLLQLIRSQLSTAAGSAPIAVVGPSGMLSELVQATMRHVLETLAELVHMPTIGDRQTQDRLAHSAAAAAAWVETYRDCQAVETFTFDPGADPMAHW